MMAAKDDYEEFRNMLNDLKMNSKPLINTLTILAEKKIHHAQLIVRAIEERILETKTEYILPALYVLDSIVKNLRSTIYVHLFETKLPVLFSVAFHKVDEDTRSAMFKLRKTWTPFFTNLCLYNLDARTHDIDPAWPITARVPDPPPFSQDNSNLNQDQSQSMTDHLRQQNDSDSTVFRTRTVNQPPISVAPPKLSELTSRAELYHMIPLDRMERIRHETAHVLDLGVDGEQQSKIRKTLEKKKKNKKRRPSTRLRRRANALLQATMNQNDDEDSSDGEDNSDENQNEEKDIDGVDDDDGPFVIKQSTALAEGFRIKPPANFQVRSTENLFGSTDKDYRENENLTSAQTKTTTSLDADKIFEINSKCLSLAEQKYKSNELSSDEYHATLKLLQNILQSEVKRLTVQQNNSPTLINNPTPQQQTNPLPFQQQLLQFAQQHAPQTTTLAPAPTFPMSTFGIDASRHVLQILATVGAPLSYISHYNFFPFLPPVPPAPAPPPPLFSSISNDRHSPPPLIKRLHDENHLDEENKRPRYDPVTGRETKIRNYEEENIAPVPSLLEANINMLKKRYIGIVQQLYIGKDQCTVCGLRFTARQKQAYAVHLDWHFIENKQEKELNTNKSNTLSQRTQNWFPSVQEWAIYEENLEEQVRLRKLMTNEVRPVEKENHLVIEGENTVSTNGIISCPATGNDDRCFVCHDPFENFFDDNREEWHLKDAIRVNGNTYHPICYQDVQYETKHLPADNSLKTLIDETNTNTSSDTISNESTNLETNPNTLESQTETDELTQADQQSSSLVDIIETLFMKKEEPTDRNEIESTVDT